MRELATDVLVVGGGLGGVAAALAASRLGCNVVLTEETDWLGGQLTSQAVPPDEHPWIEQQGCTRAYRTFRDAVRSYYRAWYPLTERARSDAYLNPGAAFVSGLSHEPRVALAAIEAMLAPHRSAGRLEVRLNERATSANVDNDAVQGVMLEDLQDSSVTTIAAAYVIDATDTGELLPLTGTEYVTGFEPRSETGEPHAPEEAQPLNMQAITFCFAVEHRAGEDHTIDRPEQYDFWKSYGAPFWPGPQLGWKAPDPQTLQPVARTLTPNPDPDPLVDAGATAPYAREGDRELWLFRRIVARRNFSPGSYGSDITLVNWPLNDYWLGPVIEVDEAKARNNLQSARQLSLSLLHWMQTDAPRPDDGSGYPGLRLRKDVVGTSDGLAKAPYVRESRRVRARHTITETELSKEARGTRGALSYVDSVGVGSYRIDLHPSTGGDNYIDIAACPFEIPLSALVPVRMLNLLPGAKNIGTTHITNGCYRVHPVEWNIGEAAGSVAAFCLFERVRPHELLESEDLFGALRSLLHKEGIQTRWSS